MEISKKIAFIGVGNMAGAIIAAAISEKNPVIAADNIYLFDKNTEKSDRFTSSGAHLLENAEEALDLCDIIFLSVKPQNFAEVLSELAACHSASLASKLYITIGAGISTSYIAAALSSCDSHGNNIAVVRAMPNTPMLVGMGVTALCRNEYVSDEDYALAENLFSASSRTFSIDECDMNKIISVTSSSPAYVFKFIKAISDGAAAQGLILDDALGIIADMLSGAAKMLKESGKTPEELIKIVTSKGGTTERAITELDRYDFDNAIISAMIKCTERADELGKLK